MYAQLGYPVSPELIRRFNQWFSPLWEGDFENPFGSFSSGESATNVREDENAYYVEMEVPGVKTENIDLSLLGGELNIKIERPEPKDDENCTYLRRERKFGTTVRKITLPLDSPPKEIEASVELGVLTVTLKKPEAAKVQKIAIQPKKNV